MSAQQALSEKHLSCTDDHTTFLNKIPYSTLTGVEPKIS